jgi:hypothetical protein
MKYDSRVAVCRNGKTAYYTSADVAERIVDGGFAMRRTRSAIDLNAADTSEKRTTAAQELFAHAKPKRLCYGGHTPPSQDRLRFAPCHFRAMTGRIGLVLTSWRPAACHA